MAQALGAVVVKLIQVAVGENLTAAALQVQPVLDHGEERKKALDLLRFL